MTKYRYRHNDNIIDIKVSNYTEQIHTDYYQEQKSSFRTITNSIFRNIKDLFLKMGKPSFKNRQADKILNSYDYNQNLREITQDINLGFRQLNQLQNINKDNTNYNNIYNDFLLHSINDIKESSDSINIYIDNPLDSNISIYEDFSSVNKLSEQSDARIDLKDNKITLNYGEMENKIDPFTNIEILDDSNGFPGNMHKVILQGDGRMSKVGNIREGDEELNAVDESEINIKFEAEENPRIYTAATIDRDDETWFEYELCNVPESKKQDPAEGFGFEYEDGTIWAKDPAEGYLKLRLRLTLPEPEQSNYLSIIPHDLPADDAGEVVIREVKVGQTETSNLETIYTRKNGDEQKTTFEVGDRIVQVVDVLFEQHSPYDADIGHIYYEHVVTTKTTTKRLIRSDKVTEDTTRERIEGPKQDLDGLMKETGQSLGDMILNFGAGGLGGAALFKAGVAGFAALGGPLSVALVGVASLVSNLLGLGTTTEVIDNKIIVGLEAFEGWRWAIGVRRIDLNAITYQQQSEVITEDYLLPGNVNRVVLNSDEFIPKEFLNIQREGWVKYYFSFGDGDWYPIQPNNLIYNNDIPSVYMINSKEFDELRDDSYKYLDLDFQPDKINFKIELQRPEDLNKLTPFVDSFNADILVSHDEVD